MWYLLAQSVAIFMSVCSKLLKQQHPIFIRLCFFYQWCCRCYCCCLFKRYKQKMSRKFSYYYLITYLLTYLVCSSATTYRKSNNPGRNLFPLSLIHINDFHARYNFSRLNLICELVLLCLFVFALNWNLTLFFSFS